jgi:hypothetical protein
MRRMVVLLGLMAVIVMVAAGVAVAVNKTCGNNLPCRGSENDDVLHERTGNGDRDRILALDGRDNVEAATFNNDRDVLDGGQKRDRILTNDGDRRDSARGGRGRDTCLTDAGDARRSCESGRVATAAEVGVVPSWFDNTTGQ